MRIEPVPRKDRGRFPVAIAGSVLIHILVVALAFAALPEADDPAEGIQVDFTVAPPPPPPPPEPEPEPPPPPKPAPLPPPNRRAEKPVETPQEPPKPVFGVTDDSVVDGDSSVAVRVGNTLMKEPEKDLTDPSQIKPYTGPDQRVYEIGELDRLPKRVAGSEPVYPPMARRAGRKGLVVLRFLIGRDGSVQDVRVVKESPPNMGFGDSAVAAAREYRYTAPTVGGIAVSVVVELPIRFTLD